MTLNQLRAVHQAKPFRPFTLQLADENEAHVRHPELMLLTPGGRTIVVATSDEDIQIIDSLLVTAIRLGDGRARRRKK